MDSNTIKDIYVQISRIAAVDAGIRRGIASGRLMFNYWPMTGQEGIPAVVSSLLTDEDYLITTYRGVHDQIAKGVPLRSFFAEAIGKRAGANKGKGGAPHLTYPEVGLMLTTAIVGGGPPIANGLALASKLSGDGRITVVNFGDGATSIGAVHEAINMAGAWKLPVIFLLQNNQIGEYTLIPDYTATEKFVDRAAGYGIKGIRADGNDIEEFHKAASEAVAYVRSGAGPVLLEAMTLRLGPHHGIGPADHLDKEAVEAGKLAAPLSLVRAKLLSEGICTEAELEEIDHAARSEVDEAIKWALEQDMPDVSELSGDIYGEVPQLPVASELGEEREMSMAQAVCDAMDVALTNDPTVILLGEDVGDPPGGVQRTSVGLQTKHGKDRVLPTPIAETAIIGAGMGAAMAGLRPICEIMFSDFLTCCMDPLVNHAAKQRYMSGGATTVPMTVRVMTEPGPGGGAGAQHSQSLEAWAAHIPGLKVVFPSSPRDAKGLLASCIADPDPCLIFESRRLLQAMKGPVPIGDFRIPLGVAEVKHEGSDISLIAYGWQVNEALKAAEDLASEGISAEVVDLRSIVPLDEETILRSARKTGRALVIHAATQSFGVSAEVAQMINVELFRELKAPADRMGGAFVPIPISGSLESQVYPTRITIASKARAIVSGNEQ